MSARFDRMLKIYAKNTIETTRWHPPREYAHVKLFLEFSEMDQEYAVNLYRENNEAAIIQQFQLYVFEYVIYKKYNYRHRGMSDCRCCNGEKYDLFEYDFGYSIFNAPSDLYIDSLKWLVRNVDVSTLISVAGKSAEFLIDNGKIILENLNYSGLNYYLRYTNFKVPYLFTSTNPSINSLMQDATKSTAKPAVRELNL